MPITKKQALTENNFHEEHEPGGNIRNWRRNGKTQTWVRSPDAFRIPVVYGLRSYGQITQYRAAEYHAESDCPDNN